MLIKLFMKILKPSDRELRRKVRGRFCNIRICFYQFMLKRLLRAYAHYAISDSVGISEGNIKVIHEFRDLGFECELARNKIDFKPQMSSATLPYMRSRSKLKRFFRFFDFEDMFKVYMDGKELCVRRGQSYVIKGSMRTKVKCSSAEMGLSQTLIEILASRGKPKPEPKSEPKPEPKSEPGPKPGPRKPWKNIFDKDKDIIRRVPVPPKEENAEEIETAGPTPPQEPEVIEKKGFEIDTTF